MKQNHQFTWELSLVWYKVPQCLRLTTMEHYGKIPLIRQHGNYSAKVSCSPDSFQDVSCQMFDTIFLCSVHNPCYGYSDLQWISINCLWYLHSLKEKVCTFNFFFIKNEICKSIIMHDHVKLFIILDWQKGTTKKTFGETCYFQA